MGPRPKTNRKRGAPRKKNEAIIKRLIAAAKLGLPYGIVSARAGITRETLCQWRAKDADLDRQLDEARAEAAEAAWLKIMAAGETGLPGAWQSIAWRLERSHPESFARPEIQLGVQINNQTNVNNTLVITAEVAEKFARRNAAIEKELDEVGKAYEAKMKDRAEAGHFDKLKTGRDQIREVEAELMSSGTITLPPPISRHPNWWNSLSKGDGHRPITPEAARYIVQTIATDVLGAQRASGLKIDLDGGDLRLSDLWAVLQNFGGWAALVKRGES